MKVGVISRTRIVEWITCATLGCGPSAIEGDSASTGESSHEATVAGSGSSDEMDPAVEACPAAEDLPWGACPSVGQSCPAGDFECECTYTDESEPDDPGSWSCRYARKPVQPIEASVTIDCEAGTIGSSVSVRFDNADGAQTITLALHEQPTYWLTPAGGGDETICAGLCGDNRACVVLAATTLEPGETADHDQEFGPGSCSPEVQEVALCSFCNGTARFFLAVDAESGVLDDRVGPELDDIPITCL